MAKNNSSGNDGAKVKLRVIEFELEGSSTSAENSIRQITSTLGARNVSPKPLSPKFTKELPGERTTDETDVVADEADVIDTETVEMNRDDAMAKKVVRKSKPKPPTYLHDLDVAGNGVSFKEFAKEKAPTTRNKRYLVVAHWLKEHGGQENVNADKIYTCFKTAVWPTDFNDWRSTFDNLVHSEHMRKVGKGEFAINPLGESAVTENKEA